MSKLVLLMMDNLKNEKCIKKHQIYCCFYYKQYKGLVKSFLWPRLHHFNSSDVMQLPLESWKTSFNFFVICSVVNYEVQNLLLLLHF